MELIIQVLMMFIAINTILKLSFWKWWQAALFGLVCSLFIIGSCQWAILQSKTQLSDYMSDKGVMQDMAVLITLESVLCFAFCFKALTGSQNGKRRIWAKLLHWYPGILLFPALFYLLTQIIYAFPGTDFTVISYVLAISVLIGIPLLSYSVKYLYPETELRLEVHFLVSLFVCLIGLITTVNGQVTYAAVEEPVNSKAVLLSLCLFIIAFVVGMFWDKIKWIIKTSRSKSNQLIHKTSNKQ